MITTPSGAPVPPLVEHPLLGLTPALSRDPLGTLTALARERGDFARMRLLAYPGVLVSHPALVEQVLLTHNRHFLKSLATHRLRAVLGEGLLTSEGDFWRKQRKLAQPGFHRERIASYATVMAEAGERAVTSWADGQARDVHHDMLVLAVEIVGKTLFGADVRDTADQVSAAVDAGLHYLIGRINSPWVLLPDWVPTPGWTRFQRSNRQLNAVVYGMIAQHRAAGDNGDLLSMLVQARDENGQPMSDRQLRDEVMTLFLAGHETTANALAWTWYLLAHHPEIVDRLQREVDGVLRGRTPGADDLPRLPFAGAVVAESLRLYPPAWSIGRRARHDVEIGGQLVRKGTVVLISQWVLHRDERFFERPDLFHPERWLEGLAARLPRFAYIPFGGGPRQCIGNGFARMEATLLLATIAQRVRLELVPNQTVVPEPTITLRPRNGLRMVVRRRDA